MNNLVKPQKQSYVGEDFQVLAYSLACEIAWATETCAVVAGVGTLLTGLPLLAGITVVCYVTYVFSSAACSGLL